jgi:hypothetical protein
MSRRDGRFVMPSPGVPARVVFPPVARLGL